MALGKAHADWLIGRVMTLETAPDPSFGVQAEPVTGFTWRRI